MMLCERSRQTARARRIRFTSPLTRSAVCWRFTGSLGRVVRRGQLWRHRGHRLEWTSVRASFGGPGSTSPDQMGGSERELNGPRQRHRHRSRAHWVEWGPLRAHRCQVRPADWRGMFGQVQQTVGPLDRPAWAREVRVRWVRRASRRPADAVSAHAPSPLSSQPEPPVATLGSAPQRCPTWPRWDTAADDVPAPTDDLLQHNIHTLNDGVPRAA